MSDNRLLAAVIGSSLIAAAPVHAGEVTILAAELVRDGTAPWRAAVTLAHDDAGWEHYADAWRVVGPDGTVYGTRTLLHPHETEQPFTRSLSGIAIPEGVTTVYVEAHDKVHGWSPQRLEIDLSRATHGRVRVSR